MKKRSIKTHEFSIPVDGYVTKDANGDKVTVLKIPYWDMNDEDTQKLESLLLSIGLNEGDVVETIEFIGNRVVSRFVLDNMRPHRSFDAEQTQYYSSNDDD